MLRKAFIYGLTLLAALGWNVPAWADGTQFSPSCSTISWNANLESDLAGYRLYDRVSLSASPTLRNSFGTGITSVTCASLGLNPGQHYMSLRAYDTSGNEGVPSTEVPFVIVVSNAITDFRATVVNATDVTLAFTEVDGGTGLPASYDVRFSVSPISWGSASSVSAGTCSTPVAGSNIGATKSCTVTGLTGSTAYQFQLVPFRGTFGVDAVYGPLSNIVSLTTGAGVPADTGRTLIVSDGFSRGNGALPNPPWMNGYTGYLTLQELSNDVTNSSPSSGAIGVWNPTDHTLEADQWAEMRVEVFNHSGLESLQLGVRWSSPPTANGYTCLARRNGSYTSSIRRYVSGANTDLITENATTWAATDIMRCEVHTVAGGTQIDLYRNNGGSPLLTVVETANTYPTGQPGIIINNTPARGDNWSAGNFAPVAGSDVCGCDIH